MNWKISDSGNCIEATSKHFSEDGHFKYWIQEIPPEVRLYATKDIMSKSKKFNTVIGAMKFANDYDEAK